MEKKRLPLAVKILNLIPRSCQKTIGYSFLGNKILQRLKSSGSKTAFDIDYGLKIYLELSNPFTWDLILGKDFEKDVKREFSQNVNEGDTVIDVGAHIGEYTLLGAKLVGDKGLIISVEPDHDSVISLKKNIILNNLSLKSFLLASIKKVPNKRPYFPKSPHKIYTKLSVCSNIFFK